MHTLPLLLLLFAGPTADAEDSGEAATAADESGSDDGALDELEAGDDEDPGAGPPGPKPKSPKGCAVADPGVLGLLALAPLLLRRRARR